MSKEEKLWIIEVLLERANMSFAQLVKMLEKLDVDYDPTLDHDSDATDEEVAEHLKEELDYWKSLVNK